MKTKEEIEEQVQGLKHMKTWLPEYNFFKENNWEQIDAQIEVLNGEDPQDYIDENEYEGTAMESAIWDASDWMDGNIDGDLFEVEK